MTDDTLAAPPPLLAPGTMLGEYRVDRLLGKGTFGEVYAGEQPVIGKRVAIKLLREKLSSDREVVARFIAEARAVNLIRHRNIVDIFSFGVIEGPRHYFVMELLEGLTLRELLEREQRLPPARALPILRGVAEALDAAHEAGVAHRDLKPDNILLVPDGDGGYAPKLLDFGLAKLLTDDMGIKTATGVAMGTPRYMSPEQCRGKSVDHRTDIYSLGVLAHVMLTGTPPFDGRTPVDLLLRHTCEPPPRMSAVCPDLPPELDGPVLAMLAKKPADRPSSAGAAVAALAAKVAEQGEVTTLPLGTIKLDAVPSAASASRPSQRATVRDAPASPGDEPRAAPPSRAKTLASEGSSTSAEASLPSPSQIPGLSRGPGSAVYVVAGVLAAALLVAAAFLAIRTPAAPSAEPTPPLAAPPAPTVVAQQRATSTAAPPATVAVTAAPIASAPLAATSAPVAETRGHVPAKDGAPRATASAKPGGHDIGF